MDQLPLRYNNMDDEDVDRHIFTLFGYIYFTYYYHDRFGWFRLFGKGLKWKDVSVHGLTFSERQKITKALTINNWRISFLK